MEMKVKLWCLLIRGTNGQMIPTNNQIKKYAYGYLQVTHGALIKKISEDYFI